MRLSNIYLYCEMITTINVVNIYQHTYQHRYNFFMTAFKIYSLTNFQIYNIINSRHHAVRDIPRTNLSYNWKFVSFDQLLPFYPSSTPCLWQAPIRSLHLS